MGKATLLRDIAAKIAEKGKPFYSAAEKAAQELPRTKGTGAEFMRELEKTKGVKPAEIQHRKLDEIKSMPKMTKEEFVKEVQARPAAQVEEKVLREPTQKDLEIEAEKLMQQDAENYVNETFGQRKFKDPEKWDDYYLDEFERLQRSEKEYYLDQAFERYKTGDANFGTKYNRDDLVLPGGENYREILLKLPGETRSADQIAKEMFGRRMNDLSPSDQNQVRSLIQSKKYTSRHWEGEPNVLAHMRVSDRTGPNGEKVLHVEEIQSDWHQAGRKGGYKPADIDKRIDDLNSQMTELSKQRDPVTNMMLEESKWFDLAKERDALVKQSVQGVPDAPFKKNWQELAMNRLLNYAAENGYDRIALTPGVEQAARYDLSKHVGYLSYKPEEGRLQAFGHDRRPVMNQAGIKPEDIEKHIGKEAAERLLSAPKTGDHHLLEGEDIKVGGEGMKGFYDKMLPDYLNKLGKKYGVEVDTIPIESGDKMVPDRAGLGMIASGEPNLVNLHSFQITPEMRQEFTEQGFPLYSAVAAPVGLGVAAQEDVLPKVGITDNEDAMKLDLMDQELKGEQGFAEGGAAFGVFPQMKGKRSKQDREAAKGMPLAAARGFVAGTMGLPSDLINLGGILYNVATGQEVGEVPYGSEHWKDVLPLKDESAAGKAATELGSMFGGAGLGRAGKAVGKEAARLINEAHLYGQGPLAGITPQAMKMDVWHGSPHRFPPTEKNPLGEFDPTKIGTGEGAQSYGYGHYTSEAKEIGKHYQKRSPKYEENLVKMYEKASSKSDYPMMEVLEDAMLHKDPEDILSKFTNAEDGYTPKHAKAAQDFAKWYEKNQPEVGGLYKVDLSDEAIPKMLDWNAKFDKQHPDVQAAILKYWSDNPALRHYGDPEKMTGEGIYGSVRAASLGPEGGSKMNLNPSNEAASMDLRHYGIPGVKYIDESHRTFDVPEGTRNFVVFPGEEDLLNIIERKAEGGKVKPPTEEMRDKLRQLRQSFVPLADEAERQKRMQQNMEQTNRKVSFSDDPETMQAEVHAAAGGEMAKLAKLLRAPAKTKQEIEAIAQRVAPQVTGEFVRGPKGTASVAGKTQKQFTREKSLPVEFVDVKEAPERRIINPEELKGKVVTGIPGDPTVTGKSLASVGDIKLDMPAPQYGGPLYGLGHGDDVFWASNLSPARGVQRVAREASEAYDAPVMGQYVMMGPESINYALHFADANLGAIDPSKMSKKQISEFNKILRFGDEKSGPRPGFPGIENKDDALLYFQLDPHLRRYFNQLMQMPTVTERLNLPNGQDIRYAITEAPLRDLETGVTGYSMGELAPDVPPSALGISSHPTYSHDIPGRFAGGLKYPTPYELTFPDTLKAVRENPKQAPQEFGSLKMVGPRQIYDQQMIDELKMYEEAMKKLTGKKKGGLIEVKKRKAKA